MFGVSLWPCFSARLARRGGPGSQTGGRGSHRRPSFAARRGDQTVEPAGITAGSDGNFWFTYSFRQDIGRMTPSGVVTDFPIPTVNVEANGIAAGSDGALWFTEYNLNAIGRMSTSGVYTQYNLQAGSRPQFITAGPDGAVLWFTEEGARDIGRITTAGAITVFPIGGAGRGPEGIAAGSDGALWLTDPANSAVGRITTTGAVTFVPIPVVGGHGASPVKLPQDRTARSVGRRRPHDPRRQRSLDDRPSHHHWGRHRLP